MHGDATALLAEIESIGVDTERGGYTRPVFSPAELRLRTWFTTHATQRGLEVETDRNGIIWAWWDPTAAHGERDEEGSGRRHDAIVTGSHLDSVPGGGNLDGPLGVASALAAVDLLRHGGVEPVRPLGIAVFPEEEGSRFGVACLGSRLITGALAPDAVRTMTDDSGRTFAEVCSGIGFDAAQIGPDPDRLAGISAFVELHVEQGRGLADLRHPVALAGAIIAHGRWHLRIEGRGDHAGATRMDDRHDPVVVASAVIQSVRRRAREARDARGTVGRIKVIPGGTNVIASAVDLWIDVRHRSEQTVRCIIDDVFEDAARAADTEGCTVVLTEQSFSARADFDPDLRAAMQSVLADAPVLDTGAGHDAGVLSSVIPTGMIFVRNPTGASHTPEESVDPADIAAGVDALRRVLAHLLTR